MDSPPSSFPVAPWELIRPLGFQPLGLYKGTGIETKMELGLAQCANGYRPWPRCTIAHHMEALAGSVSGTAPAEISAGSSETRTTLKLLAQGKSFFAAKAK